MEITGASRVLEASCSGEVESVLRLEVTGLSMAVEAVTLLFLSDSKSCRVHTWLRPKKMHNIYQDRFMRCRCTCHAYIACLCKQAQQYDTSSGIANEKRWVCVQVFT